MTFCTNCGEKLAENTIFCPNCGEKMEGANPESSGVSNERETSPQHTSSEVVPTTIHKQPMSTMKKVIIGLVVAVIALIFGAKYIINKMYDPYAQLKEMHEAFTNEELANFYSYFEFPEGTIGGADKFYDWIYDAGWPSVREDIEEQLERFEAGKSMDSIAISYRDALKLKEEKVLLGLAKKVTYAIQPLDLVIETEFDQTFISVEGVELEAGTEVENVGNFIPGFYDSTYLVKGPYTDIEGEAIMRVLPSHYESEAYLYYQVDYLIATLYSDRYSAIVYINGESTGKTYVELSSIYPIDEDVDTVVQLVDKDEDGNEIKSEEYKLEPGGIYIEFPYDQEFLVKGQLEKAYRKFRNEFMYANNYADFSYIVNYFEEGTQIYQDYKKFVEEHAEIDSYYYNFISNDVTKIEKISDSEYMLYSTEEFDFTTYEETINYIRDKSYKINVSGNDITFTEIKDLNTKKIVK